MFNHRGLSASLLAGSLLLICAQSASALTLGELKVRSALGQRLNATVPVRLASGEALSSGCVIPGFPSSDLRGVPGADVISPEAIREGTYELRVTSTAALYEPMYALELRIDCPGIPAMVRQYVLMLDLPAAVTAAEGAGSAVPGIVNVRTDRATRSTSEPATSRTTAPTRVPDLQRSSGATIETGSRYRVKRGDTLSSIAARVRDRGVSLWTFAGIIQAANPDAFIHNDPNLIKLGSEILIPSAATSASSPAVTAPANTASSVAAPAAAVPAPVAAPAPVPVPVPAVAGVTASLPEAATETVVSANRPTSPATVEATPVVPTANTPATVKPGPAPGPSATADNLTDEASAPNPFLAAGAGIIFGLLISALLWFRNRLPPRQKLSTLANKVPATGNESTNSSISPVPVPMDSTAEEPGFTVSWSEAPDDDLLAAEFADAPTEAFSSPDPGDTDFPGSAADTDATVEYRADSTVAASEDITSELEELFDSTDTTIQKRLNAEKLAAQLSDMPDDESVAAHALDDNENVIPVGNLNETPASSTVDFLVGELQNDADATALAPTVEQPRPIPKNKGAKQEQVDIHTLATQISSDNQQAQTLLEALSLLERDYENELTSSQVLDMSAIRDALGPDADEPTQVRETQVEERRKKAR
ncbi:MAG: LysM peptidoglycan-binding domain-containing protein [Gammaproteobacteria bacterium]